MNKFNKGFTLIELLVVIAIIGILSSVVLASLNTARAKGADASVRSNLANARAQAELFYDANANSYMVAAGGVTDVCSATGLVSGVKGIHANVLGAGGAVGISTVNSAAGTAGSVTTATCHSTALAWAAEVPLRSLAANQMYCVDSTGASVVTTGSTLPASDTACN